MGVDRTDIGLGVVDGTPGDDIIDAAYDGDPQGDVIDGGDAVLPGQSGDDDIVNAGAGDDVVEAGAGNDEVFGGAGNDHLSGGTGNDLLLGDTDISGGSPVREGFHWDQAPDPHGDDGTPGIDSGDKLTSFTQNTGNVDVTFTGTSTGPTVFSSDTTYMDGIDTGGAPANVDSSLDNLLQDGQSATYTLDFSNSVENVAFRINDIDGDGVLHISALDGDGNPITINLTAGSGLTLTDTDSVTGADTASDPSGSYGDDTDPDYSLLVEIPGPVSQVTVTHSQDGPLTSGIKVSDVFFDSHPDDTPGNDTLMGDEGDDTLMGEEGDDVLLGGDGDDLLFGGQGDDDLYGGSGDDAFFGGDGDDLIDGGSGNDTINGGAGVDTMSGGAGRDTFIVNSAEDGNGDAVDGGSEGDDYDTLDLSGVGAFEIVNEVDDPDGNSTSGTVNFLGTDGGVTGSMTFHEIEKIIPCFTPGTVIATPRGERLVEDLEVGDRIITRDNGLQEIRWIGRRDLVGTELLQAPHLKPVLIRAGSLGRGLPERDLLVSPNHRVLMNNEKTALYFEDREVLAAAKHLTDLEGVDAVDTGAISYIHFMFDQHEVVLSNGSWSESFQPGAQALDGMGLEQRDEIYALFPELRALEGIEAYQAARRSLKKREAKLLSK